MTEQTTVDLLWIMLSVGLVFLMQAGFLCLETGLTRSKNNINVAVKNLADFGVSTLLFWFFGFGLMYGASVGGWIGTSYLMLDFGRSSQLGVFFLFQVMFCGTAVTILSGAVAERLRFLGYIVIAALVSSVTYPLFGHWAWNGSNIGTNGGWLAQLGFVDWAGATVVHSVSGWTSLATLLVLGPRIGRFPKNGKPRLIPGSNIPLASLGVILLYVGWLGFNGGNTLALNELVVPVIGHTILAGATGLIGALIVGGLHQGRADVGLVINGCLAGLVAITAGPHAVSTIAAAFIGLVGGILMFYVSQWLEQLRIDDAVGAIPVHLGAGIWGTIAVALLGQPTLLDTGLGRWAQLGVQIVGIVVCGVWVFGVTYLFLLLFNRFFPLRVSEDAEEIGLNVTEHGMSTDLYDLLKVMEAQSKIEDFYLRVPVEPFTEVGTYCRTL